MKNNGNKKKTLTQEDVRFYIVIGFVILFVCTWVYFNIII
jgi:hypothetical protein